MVIDVVALNDKDFFELAMAPLVKHLLMVEMHCWEKWFVLECPVTYFSPLISPPPANHCLGAGVFSTLGRPFQCALLFDIIYIYWRYRLYMCIYIYNIYI